MTKTVALIQARMSSSRFPGKVLADLDGRPMIAVMLERVRRAEMLDEVAVITSIDPSDDPLADMLTAMGCPLFRGDLDDVLSRFVAAAAAFEASVIVRLTGDCPLADPAIIDAVVWLRAQANADYASNIDPPSFADGLDVECCTRAVLDRTNREAALPSEREHVTLWMRSPEASIRRVNLAGLVDTSHLRLTVDYPDDLDVVRQLVRLVGAPIAAVDQFDLLRCLSAHPELLAGNPHARNEGLLKSLSPLVG